MKHTLLKRISNNSVLRVIYGLYDECNNGYDNFECNVDVFATNGDRSHGGHFDFEGKNHYFLYTEKSDKELLTAHVPDLLPVLLVEDTDSFGLPSYPIINILYYGKQKDYKTIMDQLRLTLAEAKLISKYNIEALAEFYFDKFNGQYKTETENAMKAIAKVSGKPCKRSDIVSPTLYNDLHYKLLTDKDGWNVYKERKDKIKGYLGLELPHK